VSLRAARRGRGRGRRLRLLFGAGPGVLLIAVLALLFPLVGEGGELLSASAGAELLLAGSGAPVTCRQRWRWSWWRPAPAPRERAPAYVRSSTGKWLLRRAHGLSEREAEAAAAVRRHLSTEEIASELFVSAYMVEDHLKAIFHKVRSRREPSAALWQEQMLTAHPPSGPCAHADPQRHALARDGHVPF
jgi:DNA-binding CsgD family transcriptional regulator